MNINEAVKILRAHNTWRRAPAHLPEDAMPAMGDPRKIGIAIDTVCDALCSLDVADEGCWGVCCGNPCDKSPQAAAAHWNRRAVAARDAEIERLQAEVDRLNRLLNRIVDWDGDSILTIRAGADAFAAAKEFLQTSTPVAVDRASETRALRLADDAAESLVCSEGHNTEGRQWVLFTVDPYMEECLAHLEWRGIANVVREDGRVIVIFDDRRTER